MTRPDHEYRVDFAYGRADVTGFPRQAWMRSIRRVMIEAPSSRLGYLEGRGAPELREALAVYLNRVRGTVATPDRIVICNGFAQALHLALEVLADTGARRLAVEDPGQVDTPAVARRHHLSVAAIPADEDGIVVEALARSDADAVVVTPAHQFPVGGVLPASRREALVAWADAGSRFILEDDYDAEYRFDREPIGAIQGLAPERVLYAGSASKVLAPGLRLGWLVAPDALVDRLAEAKEASDRGSAGIEQLAFADFLARGGFDHHLRRMRPIYRRRRDRLLAALTRYVPSARPVGASAGLHLVAMLPPGIDEAAVVDGAADAGVRVHGLRRYRISETGWARRARVRLWRGPRGGHRRGRPDRRAGGRRDHVSGAMTASSVRGLRDYRPTRAARLRSKYHLGARRRLPHAVRPRQHRLDAVEEPGQSELEVLADRVRGGELGDRRERGGRPWEPVGSITMRIVSAYRCWAPNDGEPARRGTASELVVQPEVPEDEA